MEEKLHFVYRLTYKYPFDKWKYYVGKHSGLNMKDTYYKVIKNKDETYGYYNGEKLNIRVIGKLRNKDYNTSK